MINSSISDWFSESSTLYGDNAAVIDNNTTFSYRQLDCISSQIAHTILGASVSSDVVGVYLERSAHCAAAMLGVFKSGLTYLPLEVNYPPERIVNMMVDSSAQLLISSDTFASRITPYLRNVTLINLGSDTLPNRHNESFVTYNWGANNDRSCLIYTSGSTGAPACVPLSYGLLKTVAERLSSVVALHHNEAMAAIAPISFVMSPFEFIVPWKTGASVRVFSQRDIMERNFATKLVQLVNVFHAVPSLMESILNNLDTGPSKFASQAKVRHLLTGGDIVRTDLCSAMQRTFPSASISVLYGTTEASPASATHLQVTDASMSPSGSIGSPMGDSEVFILDDMLRPVTDLSIGTLYLGGSALSQGYANRPALTASRFVASPVPGHFGARLYRTGDLARYLSDGSLQWLGRADNQIKIHGQRIELGEIEHTAAAFDGVKSAAVVASTGIFAKKLLLFYICEPGVALDTHDLRLFLRRQLPDHMIPNAFQAVARFPLTKNGKVDRMFLGKLRLLARVVSTSNQTAPSPAELLTSDIWSEVLEITDINLADTVFELGADSLTINRFLSRLQAIVSVNLEPAWLLDKDCSLRIMATEIEKHLN